MSLNDSDLDLLVLNKSLNFRESVPFLSSKDFCIAPVTNPNAFLLEKAFSLGPRTNPKN